MRVGGVCGGPSRWRLSGRVLFFASFPRASRRVGSLASEDGRSRDSEPSAHDVLGHVEHAGVLVEDEVGVGGEDDPVDYFEHDHVGVLVGGEFVSVYCRDDELMDQRRGVRFERGDLFFDRSRSGTRISKRR